MKHAENAFQIISNLLEAGRLKSEVEQELADMRSGRIKSFYTDILVEKGHKAASQALEEWVGRDFKREFANSIEPIVLGMLDIARADLEDKHIRVTPVNRDMFFPTARSLGNGATLITVLDLPRHKGCGCNQPQGAEIFGEHGTLPINAIVLGVASIPGRCNLTIVIPTRENASWGSGYTAITISQDGWATGTSLFPRINEYDHLAYSLGLTQAKDVITALMSSGGSLDDRIGFPGGGAYLAKHISKLGPYLSIASQAIGKNHR